MLVWPVSGCHSIYDEIHIFSMFDLFTGIWDVLSNQEVVDFVRTRIAQRMEPEQVCKQTEINTDILLMITLHFQADRY